jgi:hypothetical protein
LLASGKTGSTKVEVVLIMWDANLFDRHEDHQKDRRFDHPGHQPF